MESNWRLNVPRVGLALGFTFGSTDVDPVLLCAELNPPLHMFGIDFYYVVKMETVTGIMGGLTFGVDRDYVNGLWSAFTPTSPFPYGFSVYPDT